VLVGFSQESFAVPLVIDSSSPGHALANNSRSVTSFNLICAALPESGTSTLFVSKANWLSETLVK